MKKINFIEEQYLSKADFIKKLYNQECIFNKLKDNNLIRASKEDSKVFKFSYVGTIFINNLLIYVMPKVYKHKDINVKNHKDIIKLFLEYSKRETLKVEEKEFLGVDDKEQKGSLLSIIDFILEDYSDNGLYYKKTKIKEVNGNGEIDWNKTIKRNQVYFTDDNEPVYYEVITTRRNRRDDYIITKIHQYIINRCLELIMKLGLDDILVYDTEEFEFDFSDIEDKQFIEEQLEKELTLVFNDRKIELMNAMLAFIRNEAFDGKDNEAIFFGTRNFEIVWEKINGYIFENKYDVYSEDIAVPKWICADTGKSNSRKTIIPDIINVESELKVFNILDAKYYTTDFVNGVIMGTVPGTEDIMKQLVYEDLLKQKYKEYEFTNTFIIPTCNKMRKIGHVEFPMSNTNKKINVVHMNIQEVMEMYCNRQTLEIFNWRCKNSIGDKSFKVGEETMKYKSIEGIELELIKR